MQNTNDSVHSLEAIFMRVQKVVHNKYPNHVIYSAIRYVPWAIGGLSLFLLVAGLVWYRDITNEKVRVFSTNEWVPFRTYTPEIESALDLLATVRPDQYEYVRSNGVPLQHLPAGKFTNFGCNADSHGCTNANSGAIAIDATQKTDSILNAAVISHELVHVQHGDSSHESARHSARRHTFLSHQEAEAHMTGNWTLLQLSHGLRPTFKSWAAMWGGFVSDFLFCSAPFLLMLLALAVELWLVYLVAKLPPKLVARAALSPSAPI